MNYSEYPDELDKAIADAREHAIEAIELHDWPKHRHGWRCLRCFVFGHAVRWGPCPRCPHRAAG